MTWSKVHVAMFEALTSDCEPQALSTNRYDPPVFVAILPHFKAPVKSDVMITPRKKSKKLRAKPECL